MSSKYCLIGIDCDPDRNSKELQWTGLDSMKDILPYARFTLNIRCDPQANTFDHDIVQEAIKHNSSVGVHYHRCNKEGAYSTEFDEYLDIPKEEYRISMHDGWCHNELLKRQAELGYKFNYSPMPESHGPYYDWRGWPNSPVWYNEMLILPVQTIKTRIARTYNKVATVHPTAPHFLFKKLVEAFEETGNDTFCCYFHSDELNGAIGGLRGKVYSKRNLLKNIEYLDKKGFTFENANQIYERFCSRREKEQGFIFYR